MDPIHVRIEDSIDLHAFAPGDVPSVVEAYVEAAHAAGYEIVRLIHGRGRGHQRARVHRILRTSPLVRDVWDDPRSHLGATCARLRCGEQAT